MSSNDGVVCNFHNLRDASFAKDVLRKKNGKDGMSFKKREKSQKLVSSKFPPWLTIEIDPLVLRHFGGRERILS